MNTNSQRNEYTFIVIDYVDTVCSDKKIIYVKSVI